jgi:hypothetical protein
MSFTHDTIAAGITVDAPVDTVFAILADPATHQAIDGTGWVREPLNSARITGIDQIFRMAMYFDNPEEDDNHYEVANRVTVFDPPHAIAWQPGQGADDDELEFGGWFWRYDLGQLDDDRTTVRLTYDWSGVPPQLRDKISFPPFEPSHLDNSLRNLTELAEAR